MVMNPRTLNLLRILLSLALELMVATALQADTPLKLQNGVNGCTGAPDFSVSTQYVPYNGGDGTRSTGIAQPGCFVTSGTAEGEMPYLLKFIGLNIPVGYRVISASLKIYPEWWSSVTRSTTGFYLKNSLDAASTQPGWLHRDGTNDRSAGTSSANAYSVTAKSSQLPEFRPIGAAPMTISLNAAQVQSWIDTPETNSGVMLVNNNPGDIFGITSTVGTRASRAILTVVITNAAETNPPTSGPVATGATKQFTATVANTTDTGVTWAATDGTISSSELYKSTTQRTSTVTATSVEDTRKYSSATATVGTPQDIRVSISPPSAIIPRGTTQQFTATVVNASNPAVTWTAKGGTISPSGLFTAGNIGGIFMVWATSVEDPTKSAMIKGSIRGLSIGISPPSVSLSPNGTQQFTATVANSTNTAVSWTATGGTVSSTGLYAAGNTPGTFTVTATSAQDATRSSSATVTVMPAISVGVSPTSASLVPGGTQQFTATVSGSSNQSVTWAASGGTISSSGFYTASQTPGNFAVTATSVADTTKNGTASVEINSSTRTLPPVPRQFDGPFVITQSPVSGMHFSAPGTIRIYADPYDPNANDPDAVTVTYRLNGQSVGTFTGSGNRNGYFPFTVTNLAAGTYSITTQITTGGRTVTSFPVTVFVDDPPASSGPVFNLTSDVVLSGAQVQNYVGTAANHCTINGNGFQIRSAADFTGTLNISFCDVHNLGTATNPGIKVTAGGSGSIQLLNNVWETFGTVSVAANSTAQLAVRNNEFRENTLVPATNLPIVFANETLPVVVLGGDSSTQKFFQGNNVGLSTVLFENTRNWLIGGNTDAESNILMGVRCGFTVRNSTGMVVRGNYSQHNYPHRMSQGDNFELEGDGFLVEHNIIRDSSWPVRGMGGELRYNLIDSSGTLDQVIQGPLSNTNMHHNIITYTVSQALFAPGSGVRVMFGVDNVQFNNNTMDGSGPFMGFSGAPIRVFAGTFISSLRNNVIYNFAGLADEPMLAGDQGESTNPPLARLRYADYNDFYNPDAPNQTNYGLGVVGRTPGSAGYGQHDLGGFNGHRDPKFTAPTALPFPFFAEDIWSRTKKVSDILSTYRAMYTPGAGSPLIGAGDPQDGSPNIGAIGNGEAADQFGRFGTGSPTAPVITSFTANPGSIQSGQSSTLSWSVTGATTLSISPGVGTVTGTSTTVSPIGTTMYTLTALNAGGSVTMQTTVTVTSTPPVSVTISPTTASVQTGATKQFSATVANAGNNTVNWTATGGTVSSSGLFTAGNTAGTFTVTATSAQDNTKSDSATVTITTAAPVSVVVSPTNPTVFTNGTQQFTATVTNAANTAVTWTATGGTVSSTGLYTAGTTTGSFSVTATSVQDTTKSGTTSITISTAPAPGSHPRIILDEQTLATLRTRMQAHTQEWNRLKATCDSYIGGQAQFINGNDYPNRPNIGEGYQGSGYIEALMPLGLCYQTIRVSDPTAAANYATVSVNILMAMSDPNNQIADDCNCIVPRRDAGYGIRNFGVAMGIGYDWFHDVMSAVQRTQLQTALQSWIDSFEHDTFEFDHPQGNYFAGYYAAKVMAALAVEGDNPIGATWWNDWYNNQHLGRVAPYYRANLAGGGWTEGYSQYGILATRNQSLPVLAVKTAKNIDLIQAGNPQTSYTYPLDNPRWLMAFTWPTRDLVDDRGELYSTGDANLWPGTGRMDTYRFSAGFLQMMGDPAAPMMHKYARDAKTALDALNAGDTSEWIDFLFWDPTAPEADYTTLARSYLAPGMGGVTARSDWSTSATFMSFMSGPYINNPAAGHEWFDKGSPAFERNKNPLLVNPGAWLAHEPFGDPGWSLKFDDQFGNWGADHNIGNRTLYNTFQVRQLNAQGNLVAPYGQSSSQRSDGARTAVGRFEDAGSYVLAVGTHLEDMYYPFHDPATGQPTICSGAPSAVTMLTRQIVYLRPSQFIIFDRSGVCDRSLDQYEAFHFPANPVEVTAPAPGLHRFDVNPGVFAGSMTTIIPANANIVTTDRLLNSTDSRTWNKMWRLEVRPTDAQTTNRLWLTVFDLASTPGLVAAATRVNVTAGPVVGALLQAATGNNVVLSGTAPFGTNISGSISYTVPATQTRHVITDWAPSAGYTITVTVSGGNHLVTVTPGGSFMSSANGVLTFQVSSSGQVTP